MAKTTSKRIARKLARERQLQQLAWLLARYRREEEGGLILFSLFILVMMLIVGGVAVDVMRFETERTMLQNTLDSATLAATNINRDDIDPEQMVKDFMEKVGYDPDLVSVSFEEDRLGVDEAAGEDGTLIGRRVSANYDLAVDTFFMPLIGIDTLGTNNAGTAEQKVQNVEISLVVDISGSMNGTRLADLKTSAKTFFKSVIGTGSQSGETEGVVSISVIPYNHTIVVDEELLDRLNTNPLVTIADADIARPSTTAAPYTGAIGTMIDEVTGETITEYQLYSSGSRCIRFRDDELTTADLTGDYAELRAITETQPLERMGYYDADTMSLEHDTIDRRPGDDWNRRCDPTRGAILPYSTDLTTLDNHIEALTAGGWTAIDNGLKWASALLDPAMRDVVNAMIDDGVLPEEVRNRPGDYDPDDTLKVIVLMTDGANTTQYDLKDNYKVGPSRVWYSSMAANETNPEASPGDPDYDWSDEHIVDVWGGGYYGDESDDVADREKQWYDGYFVEFPNNPESTRFLRPHSLDDSYDGRLYDVSELPPDAEQQTYAQLYDRLAERDVARLFLDYNLVGYSDYNNHYYAEKSVVNSSKADRRMLGTSSNSLYGMCDVVKRKEDPDDIPEVLIFSIAFQAGSHAESVLRECATSDAYYYDAANGAELNEAFAAIAGAISKLRLTQ